jgi:hypothetical protein
METSKKCKRNEIVKSLPPDSEAFGSARLAPKQMMCPLQFR